MAGHGLSDAGAVCFIVPPYILQALSSHEDESVRAAAAESLLLSERLRARRPLEALLARMSPLVRGDAAEAGEQRRVFTCRHTTHVPGMIVRGEGDAAVPDAAVDEAYEAAGTTYDFYKTVFGRNSIDDRGMHLLSSVHYAKKFDNAFWNGLQMVYGDGDGVVFGSFTTCLDVIGHELTHGVVQSEGGLEYEGQSGALNESIADVFGSLVKQWHLQQSAERADWLIGAGLLTAKVHGRALRSMKAPGTAYDDPMLGGKDRQPAHMRDFAKIDTDQGGVHINSGIPNHAFYLVARELGGAAWETAGHVWYDALTSGLRPETTFEGFRIATESAAKRYGAKAEAAVKLAWRKVGVRDEHEGRLID